jgi:hypothetical protein
VKNLRLVSIITSASRMQHCLKYKIWTLISPWRETWTSLSAMQQHHSLGSALDLILIRDRPVKSYWLMITLMISENGSKMK